MIRTLVLHNVGPFRGKHILKFKSSVYAVIAKHDEDPGRSNRSGKSFLLEMINFAVTGRLNKQRKGGSEGWISRGEKTGRTKLVLHDGVSISREKTRGKPVQIRMKRADGSIASQAEADRLFLKHLSFSEDDFSTVGYFEQGKMSRIIHARPEDRMDAVRGWLDLGQAEQAESRAKDLASMRVKELQRLRSRHEVLSETDLTSTLPDKAAFEKVFSETAVQMEAIHREVGRRQIQLTHQATVTRYREILSEKKELTLEVAQIPEDLEERFKDASSAVNELRIVAAEAKREVSNKSRIALGMFDGVCPVASIECPATKQINRDRVASAQALQEAKKVFSDATYRLQTVSNEFEEISVAHTQAVQKRRDLERRQRDVDKLKDSFLEAKQALKESENQQSDQELRIEYSRLRQLQTEAQEALASLKAKQEQRLRTVQELEALDESIQTIGGLAAAAIQARSIFKATQRRVAERVLEVIGNRANNLLSGAGIDLSVDIQWEQEGKKYASACEMCGTSFPASAKVKICSSCNAERGQQIIHKLKFEVSEQSGGANDMGGVALQIAAGSWLLHKRQSPWQTLMLDEPLAALDRTTRRAAAKQFMNLLDSSAYRQVFVIAHSQEILDQFPSCVIIHVAKDGTRRIEQS